MKNNNKNEKNNPQITGIMYFFSFLFVCLILYMGYFVYSDKEMLINNAYNPRQAMLAEKVIRGTIYSKNNEVLAETKVSKNNVETRVYPYENLFAHVIGFSSNGRMGVESNENYHLITSDIPVDEKLQNEIKGIKNPGNSVVTTLDVDLQQVLSDALGVYKGAAIAIEPSTGKILAMVSKPDFDPNEIPEKWEDIIHDDSSTVLLNRVTQGLYPPGSTFKMMTALEYIRENPDNYTNYHYDCNGKFTLGDSSIQCYHRTAHGALDLKSSFAKSCNSSFANIGTNLDYGKFQDTLDSLLFNQKLPVSFNTKQSSIAVSPDTDPKDMMQMAIGQGATQMTPLHLAMITQAVANQGTLMIPYMVDHVLDANQNIVNQYEPSNYGMLMTTEEASILQSYMEEVVHSGTGKKLSGLSYTAAGKTGSAEYNGVKEDSHAWFTGYAPVRNPEIVVTIILEGAGSGGDYAVPIAKRIFNAYFKE
ncbi:MAG: penicillin-binding transpeptidase domain-containing protein [Lachnospiraceae bacterium]|nr:penicillin-binding transpeptidase domain-containing protein [Lachnospiraceae bacterium]